MKACWSALAAAGIILGSVQSSSAVPQIGAAARENSMVVEIKAKKSASTKKSSSKPSDDMKGMKQDDMKGMDHSKMKM